MKVSAELCFCLFMPFFMLFVTETFANIIDDVTAFTSPYAKDINPTVRCQKTVSKANFEETDTQIKFEQKLDHFDSTNVQYFQQRYILYKSESYVAGNPVFLLAGGTGELKPCDVEVGIWHRFAKDSGALLLALEHRMYGKSYPDNMDFTTNNLVNLNTEQALADLAFFIDELVLHNPAQFSIPRHAKWIAMGSSYGGTLAALLKLKYPHLIKAAVTINAPLFPTVAFEEFYNVVEQQCKEKEIYETMKEAFDELKQSFDSCMDDEINCIGTQMQTLRETFNLCVEDLSTDYKGKEHKEFLYWSLTTIIGLALQFGNESNRTVRTEVIDILLNNDIPKALDRLGEAVKHVLKSHNNIQCLHVNYGSLIESYKDVSKEAENNLNYILYSGLGNRQTLYQHCSEWGHFETAYKDEGIFAKLIPKEFYVTICIKVFGLRFNAEYLNEAIKRTDMFYGGREVIVNNVVFILRDDDFWTQLGYKGRTPKHELKDDDSFTILLKPDENGVACTSQECKSDWSFIVKTLSRWSGVTMAEENNAGETDKQDPEQNNTVGDSGQ